MITRKPNHSVNLRLTSAGFRRMAIWLAERLSEDRLRQITLGSYIENVAKIAEDNLNDLWPDSTQIDPYYFGNLAVNPTNLASGISATIPVYLEDFEISQYPKE